MFVLLLEKSLYSMLGLCMHAGILIYAGHRLPETGNR